MIQTTSQLIDWCAGASERFGDPSTPVWQALFRWVEDPTTHQGDELVCGMCLGEFVLLLGPGQMLPLPVVAGEARVETPDDATSPLLDEPQITAYGAEPIAPGVWSISPSLFIPRALHVFVILRGVPHPAPWNKPKIEIFQTVGGGL